MEAVIKTNQTTFIGKLLSEDLNVLVLLSKNNMHYMIYKNNVVYVQKFNTETNVNNIKEVDLLENLKSKTITVILSDGNEITGTLKQYYKDKVIVSMDNATYEIYKHAIIAIMFR